MIYHLFKGNTYHLSPAIIESIIFNADKTNIRGKEEHFFLIMNFSKRLNYKYAENPYEKLFNKYNIRNKRYLNKYIALVLFIIKYNNSNNKIILHSFIQPFLLQLSVFIFLYIFSRKKLATISLVCWGQNDFYFDKRFKAAIIINFLLKIIYKKLDNIITISPGDRNLFISIYKRTNCQLIPYISSRNIPEYVNNYSKENTVKIMVSHSGWEHNYHLKTFNLLSKFSEENIEIICPLVYGNEAYIKKVIDKGTLIFGKKFKFFTELKPREEYENFIKSINIYISSTEIQTGLFALITSLLYGKKVFITGNLKFSMEEYGFFINDINKIPQLNFKEFSEVLNADQINHNLKIYKTKYAPLGEIQERWAKIYNH